MAKNPRSRCGATLKWHGTLIAWETPFPTSWRQSVVSSSAGCNLGVLTRTLVIPSLETDPPAVSVPSPPPSGGMSPVGEPVSGGAEEIDGTIN